VEDDGDAEAGARGQVVTHVDRCAMGPERAADLQHQRPGRRAHPVESVALRAGHVEPTFIGPRDDRRDQWLQRNERGTVQRFDMVPGAQACKVRRGAEVDPRDVDPRVLRRIRVIDDFPCELGRELRHFEAAEAAHEAGAAYRRGRRRGVLDLALRRCHIHLQLDDPFLAASAEVELHGAADLQVVHDEVAELLRARHGHTADRDEDVPCPHSCDLRRFAAGHAADAQRREGRQAEVLGALAFERARLEAEVGHLLAGDVGPLEDRGSRVAGVQAPRRARPVGFDAAQDGGIRVRVIFARADGDAAGCDGGEQQEL
jgi:hypothetical protein